MCKLYLGLVLVESDVDDSFTVLVESDVDDSCNLTANLTAYEIMYGYSRKDHRSETWNAADKTSVFADPRTVLQRVREPMLKLENPTSKAVLDFFLLFLPVTYIKEVLLYYTNQDSKAICWFMCAYFG